MTRTAREHLTAIFRAGVHAVDPAEAVRRHVATAGQALRIGATDYDLGQVGRVYVIGFGKAAAHMAQALEGLLDDRIHSGVVNVKTGHGVNLKRVRVNEAAHPVPDEAGVDGAREIAGLAEQATADDLVVCCISGGGSALLPLPAEGLSLGDKQDVTRQLLACGATIHEVNAVRKHLSAVKGGQLARLAHPARVATLILSDVIGDPLDVIASGPTAPDPTTFADALDILDRYGISERVPESALHRLREGKAGSVPETPKPDDAVFAHVNNVIVASNRAAVAACAGKAKQLGYAPLVLTTTASGEASEVAKVLVAVGREAMDSGRPVAPPACIIMGGETTVTLRGNGLGGRNQELALAAALAAEGLRGVSLLAAGTDGTDGPTDAAGAFADGETVRRGREAGLSAAEYLAGNDSCHFFEPLDDLLKTGPTGTNVMDLYLMLLSGRPAT